MQTRAITYQRNLLINLITTAETEDVLTPSETEQFHKQITDVDSTEDVDELWIELEQHYGLLDEDVWSTEGKHSSERPRQ
ncbi:hypothetical protein [Haladaptatus halobius]|uniref:hypothetical protein n=1 Tax=Haladaptatus halobius TaxID=2884875 RepID=UPI001D0B00C4|nr:hypothetical protein [Haladaptatus halobius]